MCTHDSHYGSSWRFAHLHVVFPAGFSFEPVILFRVLAFSGCWSAAEASGPGRGYIYIYIYIDIVRPCSKGWSQSQLIKSVFPCFLRKWAMWLRGSTFSENDPRKNRYISRSCIKNTTLLRCFQKLSGRTYIGGYTYIYILRKSETGSPYNSYLFVIFFQINMSLTGTFRRPGRCAWWKRPQYREAFGFEKKEDLWQKVASVQKKCVWGRGRKSMRTISASTHHTAGWMSTRAPSS